MDNETSRKIIVAGCMAAVLAVGITVFALRHPTAPAVAQQPMPPPSTTEQAPPAPSEVTQSGEGTSQPAPADSVAGNDGASAALVTKSTPPTVQPRSRPITPSLAVANVGAKPRSAVAAPADAASAALAAPAVNETNDSEATGTPTTGDSATDASKPNGGSDYVAADRQITIDVKTEISRDGSDKGAVIEVTTDHGVVALSGSVPDQNTFDHVKEVVARVKGVTSVDTSALSVGSLVSSAIQQ
jgi:BON domain